ncbi:PAS domain S-box protein [Leisingera aquaemixtae]|uniref:sensor histidine kinase n=1 Tax=Leisingera aquaemixtae TaxID=1396826 RepID=UPI001C98184F|nr:PAS domain-containing sensor histidine kinase [Leisingera aquaemixtae]MBY6069313.1 PAS domain S-box protein [Leisingera aquaemixtae]
MTFARQADTHRRPLLPVSSSQRAQAAAALLICAGFLFDYLTPLGVAAGLIYTSVVLCAVWAGTPSAAYSYAAAGTGLTILGYILFHRSGVNEWIVLTNRGLTVCALWAFAFIVCRQKSIQISLEHKQNELTAIRDNSIEGIITIDSQGLILSYNRACRKIFGYTKEEAIGRNVSILMPEPQKSQHDSYLRDYFQTWQRNFIGASREVQGQRKDGSIFPLTASVSEIRVGGHILFSGIVRDISEQKRADAEREQFVEELSRSNRDLDEFAYIASHDLRAPLRVIDNASSWLEEDLADTLDEDSLENLQLLRSRVLRMDRLLDDLLEYSRAGRKTDHRYQQLMPGTELLKEALLLIDQPEGFTIRIDPGFEGIQLVNMPLKQIFANLISNAIKHSETGAGTVDVSLRDEGGHWLFSVADDGPGIEPKYHEKIFKMFQTLKSRDQVEGSGMGLSIVQKHVQQAGGKILVHSAPGEGCEFSFTWPKPQPELAAGAS